MAFPRLDIVDPNSTSTVLFSFNDNGGTVNPSSVKTKMAAVRWGVNTQVLTAENQELPGGSVLRHREGLWQSAVTFSYSATTGDVAATVLGTVAKLLAQGGVMAWQRTSGSTERFVDLLPSPRFSQLLGEHLADLARGPGELTVEFVMQPGVRGAAVTSSSDTVEDDPATGTPDGSRVYALTVTGDLPTPGQVRAQMDTGSAVQRVLIGHRARGTKPSTFFSDYIADTAWFQCEATNRNWTITLSNDTAAAADGALASPATGNVVAQVNGAGSSAGQFVRRIRATRTAAMDSLRGSWEPYLRVKATGSARWRIRAYWGPSTADPAPLPLDLVYHDTSLDGTPAAFGYVEKKLGVFHIPETVALSGMAFDVYASRLSGSGNLNMDLVWFPPYPTSTVVVAGASSLKVDGAELATPVTNPASGTAGTVNGTALDLDTTTDNAGQPPAGGTVLTAGRYVVTWKFELSGGPPGGGTVRAVIRNVTGSTDTYSQTITVSGSGVTTHRAYFDANGTSTYQAQADDPSTTFIRVNSIQRDFTAAILVNESVRTDPARYAVDRLDSSGNLSGYLDIEGPVPALLQPGDNHLMIRADDVPLARYEENENKLDRDLTVTVTYFPRFMP